MPGSNIYSMNPLAGERTGRNVTQVLKPENSLSGATGGNGILGKLGLNGSLGNLALGLGIGAATKGLSAWEDSYMNKMTPYQLQLFTAIYGRGDDPIFDLFSLSSDNKAAVNNIHNSVNNDVSILNSNEDLINRFNSIDFNKYKDPEKMSFGHGIAKGYESFGKGATIGSVFGPLGALIGGEIGFLANGLGFIGSKKRRNNIIGANAIARLKELDNYDLAVRQSLNLRNINRLANTRLSAFGGLLDYDLLNLQTNNQQMNVLNKGKITSMPNSFYKPQFDSVNYFALGGMPDFTEFNTGGTHEENSLGGIPVKQHIDGSVSLVEQDETMTKTPNGDYIFSNRLKLSNEECKTLKIPKGSTYAEASKILRKEYDENPNDEIARKGWELFRNILIQSLEMLKQEIALKESRKQGINTNIQSNLEGNSRKFDKGGNIYDIVQLGSLIPSIILGIKGPDYSYANEVLNSIGKEQRLSIPNNYTYYTYNPVNELQYLNRQQAEDAALINTLLNTSNPSRNSSILAATALNAANRSKLMNDIANINYARKTENTKLNNAITDQVNSNLITLATHNLQLDNSDYNKMIQGLKMKQEADNIVGTSLSSGLTGILKWADARRQEENSLDIAALSAIALGVPFTDSMINALYGINSKLGDIGFSTRSDYSAYKNNAQRLAIISALNSGMYDKSIYGNLDNYLEDLAIKDFIISQYTQDKNWTGTNLGLSPNQLLLIINSINTRS